MSADVTLRELAGTPWLVARGSRVDVFRALGELTAPQVRQLTQELPDLTRLRDRLSSDVIVGRVAALAQASEQNHPAAWCELQAVAEGAGVSFDDLLLLNLRGDLGTDEGFGCSDFACLTQGRLLIGHNEDGHPALNGQCYWLSVEVDDEPRFTTWWYPGFLPGNTFTITEDGLTIGVDNLNVVQPGEGVGRAFVARELPRTRTVRDAVDALRRFPSAGAFAFTIASASEKKVLIIEPLGGTIRVRDAAASLRGAEWHTNHLRFYDPGLDAPGPDSAVRGKTLQTARVPRTGPELLELLAAPRSAKSVHRGGEDGRSLTLCSCVADLAADLLTIVPYGGNMVSLSLSAFARGEFVERPNVDGGVVFGMAQPPTHGAQK